MRQWDEFWFQPADPLALGVLRLLTGLMLVYTHLVWGMQLDAFFGPHGFQDPLLVQALGHDSAAWTFWSLVPDAYLVPVHWTCVGLLVLYTLGLWTKFTKWAAPIITISYANRAPNANFGLDQINAMLAVYLALGPCGARLSLDRWWRVYRHGVRSLEEQGSWSTPEVLPSSWARLSTRLIQVHMCVIYFFAGVSKLKGEAWWNGDAVWMALANAEYQSWDMTWLAWYPWVSDIATHVTTLFEMTFWILVWRPAWRPAVLLLGALMHLGIGAFLGMWTFGLIMLLTYISYIPPEKFRAVRGGIAEWLPPVQRVPWNIPRGRWLPLHWAGLRKSLDLRNRLQLVVVNPSVDARTRESRVTENPSFMTSAEWWSRIKHDLTGWPFAACDRMDIHQPRIILVHALLDVLSSVQNYFQSKGFDCRATSTVSGACEALFDRPTDVLLLMGDAPRECDELLLLRDILRRAGAQAPSSVTVIPRLPDDSHLEQPPDHLLWIGSATYGELRLQVTRALLERTCVEEEAVWLAAMHRPREPVPCTPPPQAVESPANSSDSEDSAD